MPSVITKRDPVTGRFLLEGSRHFMAPLEALQSGRVRGVRMQKPVRGGGTLVADLYVPWALENDNASVLWIFQSDDLAKRHAETRQMPICKSVRGIGELQSVDRHKTRTTDMVLADGRPFSIQGPAFTGLQSVGYQVVVFDECHCYEPGVISEGIGRLGDALKVQRSKLLAISQGGEENSEWDMLYREGEEYVWHVQCAGCQEYMTLEWSRRQENGEKAGMVYDEVMGADGLLDREATAASARYVCHNCGHAHQSGAGTWLAWDATGKYISSKTGRDFDKAALPTEISFRWTAIMDFPWAELVKLWLSAIDAKKVGNYVPLIAFFQKRMALMRSENSMHDVDLPFKRVPKKEVSRELQPGELDRFLTFDRQAEDVFWVQARSWFVGGRSNRLWAGRLFSFEDIEAKRIELGIEPNCVAGDSGYKPKGDDGVYRACIKYGWIALKGVGEVSGFWHTVKPRFRGDPPQRVWRPWAPITFGDPGMGTSEQGKTHCPLIRFSSDAMADKVHEQIKAGLWEEPEEADDITEDDRQYRIQMAAEFPKMVFSKTKNRVERQWTCPSKNNHQFDAAKGQELCVMVAELLPSDYDLSTTPEERGVAAATA
jgi:hypothetical protein